MKYTVQLLQKSLRNLFIVFTGAALTTTLYSGVIVNEPDTITAEATKGPPLPLHQIEGNGGIFSTLSAHLVNPPRNGEIVGRPSFGLAFVSLGNGKNLQVLTVTESPLDRLELGYAYQRLHLGDFRDATRRATSVDLGKSVVEQHNFNARFALLKEGDFGVSWLPALTFGVHFKDNTTIKGFDNRLGKALTGIGIEHHTGVDYTLYASKTFTFLPRPFILSGGVRATEGAHLGLLGFTDSYTFQFEGNICVAVTDRLMVGGEYRAKPNEYKAIPGLINGEDDWWTIDAAYIFNDHLTVAVGYGHFGDVLNHKANGSWGVTVKYEF